MFIDYSPSSLVLKKSTYKNCFPRYTLYFVIYGLFIEELANSIELHKCTSDFCYKIAYTHSAGFHKQKVSIPRNCVASKLYLWCAYSFCYILGSTTFAGKFILGVLTHTISWIGGDETLKSVSIHIAWLNQVSWSPEYLR